MSIGFRRTDSTLEAVLGVLSWCADLKRAIQPWQRASPAPPLLVEHHLVSPDADDAICLLLGMIAFEGAFQGLVDRCAALQPVQGTAVPSAVESKGIERLTR